MVQHWAWLRHSWAGWPGCGLLCRRWPPPCSFFTSSAILSGRCRTTRARWRFPPADGRVVEIRTLEHQGRPVRRISIFLSPFDVHVNRAPIAGFIRDVQYSPGRFRMAARPEASIENESNLVTVEGPEGVIAFKQIAGLVARRIVFWKKQGDHVARGERVGLIKLGSRVDLFLDESWEVLVPRGKRVRAGSTILARRN